MPSAAICRDVTVQASPSRATDSTRDWNPGLSVMVGGLGRAGGGQIHLGMAQNMSKYVKICQNAWRYLHLSGKGMFLHSDSDGILGF